MFNEFVSYGFGFFSQSAQSMKLGLRLCGVTSSAGHIPPFRRDGTNAEDSISVLSIVRSQPDPSAAVPSLRCNGVSSY